MPKKNRQKINTIIVTSGSLLLLAWVGFRIFFPVFHFVYNGNNIDDDFIIRKINQKTYWQLKLKGGYPFSSIKIKMPKNSVELGNVYQDELVLYTAGQKIKSMDDLKQYLNSGSSDIMNGELISKGDSVFFVEDGKYRSFADAETFDTLGFDWDKVEKAQGREFSNLEKGEDITHKTIYLNDLFVEIGNKLFLLEDNRRIEIDNKEVKKFIKNKFSIISIPKTKMQSALVGTMICQQGKIFSKKKCLLQRNENNILPRAEILIEATPGQQANQVTATVDTFDGFNSLVPSITVKNIKRLINIRYQEEIEKLKNLF